MGTSPRDSRCACGCTAIGSVLRSKYPGQKTRVRRPNGIFIPWWCGARRSARPSSLVGSFGAGPRRSRRNPKPLLLWCGGHGEAHRLTAEDLAQLPSADLAKPGVLTLRVIGRVGFELLHHEAGLG